MNRIQLMSRDIEAERLKLQMGIDPAADIDHDTVRAMWRELNSERLMARTSDVPGTTEVEPLPSEPAFLDELRVGGF